MKLRDGDRTEVKPNGKLNLVYLQSGKVEQWDGPASFIVGGERTQKIISGTPVTQQAANGNGGTHRARTGSGE